jgi:flagellar hook-associated protein 3 FlgL
MSRVSENSSIHSINYAVGKTKGRLEDLQMKGSTLKRMNKPSDDPVGNAELLAIRSQNIDAGQYMRNINFAQTQLAYTEDVLEEMTELLNKAKELFKQHGGTNKGLLDSLTITASSSRTRNGQSKTVENGVQ